MKIIIAVLDWKNKKIFNAKFGKKYEEQKKSDLNENKRMLDKKQQHRIPRNLCNLQQQPKKTININTRNNTKKENFKWKKKNAEWNARFTAGL